MGVFHDKQKIRHLPCLALSDQFLLQGERALIVHGAQIFEEDGAHGSVPVFLSRRSGSLQEKAFLFDGDGKMLTGSGINR